MEKNLDGNYTKMLQAILNMSWRQHPTKLQLYGHLPLIPKTIKIRRTRHVGHCWRNRDELISEVLLWTPSYGWAKAGKPAWTNIQQHCAETGCSPEDLPEAMDDREGWLIAQHYDDDDVQKTLIGTTPLWVNKHWNNSNEVNISELKYHQQMQFGSILMIPFFEDGLTSLQMMQSPYSKLHTDYAPKEGSRMNKLKYCVNNIKNLKK